MSTVFERVRQILVDLLGVSDAQVLPTTSFKDLSVDSLDLVEIVIRIEDEFAGEYESGGKKFEITDEEAKNIKTIGDVVDYLKSAGIEDQGALR
jgi:acyl carrier protein